MGVIWQMSEHFLRLVTIVVLSIWMLGCQATGVTYPNTNRADADIVKAYLSKPEGEGPFPAVMLLHGCTGLERDLKSTVWRGLSNHASALNDAGFVTLIVDSLGTRGYSTKWSWTHSCNGGWQGKPSYVNDRTLDVTGSIRYLESLPYVNPGIGALGINQGGGVVLEALGWRRSSVRKSVLVAGVALYPPCVSASEILVRSDADTARRRRY